MPLNNGTPVETGFGIPRRECLNDAGFGLGFARKPSLKPTLPNSIMPSMNEHPVTTRVTGCLETKHQNQKSTPARSFKA